MANQKAQSKMPNLMESKKLLLAIIQWLNGLNQSSESSERIVKWLLSGNTETGTFGKLEMKRRLQPLLPILSNCCDNVKFIGQDKQTILHLCIEHYIKPRGQTKGGREIEKDQWFIATVCGMDASIIVANRAGDTPLGMVLAKNRLDLVDTMLRHGCTYVNLSNCLGQTAMHILIDKYDYNNSDRDQRKLFDQFVHDLICREANLKKTDANGMTPGHLAVKHGYLKPFDKFQRRGLLSNSRTNVGDDLLILACKNVTRNCDQSKFIDSLLTDQGLKAYCKNNHGFTPLHYASIGNNLTLIVKLIKHGAYIHSVASDNTNPFHSAILSPDEKVMQYFIQRRVKFYRRDNVYGFTLMHMSAFICNQTKFEWLIEQGFDPHDHAKCNVSALHLAAMVGNVQIVHQLLRYGADVHCRDEKCEYTPLHLASMCGQFANVQQMIPVGQADGNSSLVAHCLKIIQSEPDSKLSYKNTIITLLKAGADVNAKDYRCRKPLHYATRQKDQELIKILLDAGANVDDLDSEGLSPLHYSIASDNYQGIQYLLRFGADINDIRHCHDIYNEISNYQSPIVAYDLFEHLVKLKIADLPINNVYEPLFNDIDLKKDYAKYFAELKQLKELKVAPNVSLYDLLHLNSRRRLIFIHDLPDLGISNPKIVFPHYFNIIEGVCHEAVNRKALLVSAKMSFRLLAGMHFPDICIEYIFSFLNNRTLRVLIESANESETSDLEIIDDSKDRKRKSSFRSLLKTPSIDNFIRRSSIRAFFSSLKRSKRASTNSSLKSHLYSDRYW